MEVTYSLFNNEVIEVNNHFLESNTKKYISIRVLYSLLTLMIFVALSEVEENNLTSFFTFLAGIAGTIIVFLIFPKFLRLKNKSAISKLILSNDGMHLLSEKKVILTEKCIEIRSDYRTSWTPYKSIKSSVEINGMIYITFIMGDIWYIPTRAFQSSADKNNFVEFMNNKMKEAHFNCA